MPGLRTFIATFVVVALAGVTVPAHAQERYKRDWSDHPGMPRQIWDLTYDDRGFLWLASEEGVHRFDGREVVPWGSVSDSIVGINRGPDSRMVAYTDVGAGFEVAADGLRPLQDIPFERIRDAVYDAKGGLWVGAESGLFRRDVDGQWTQIEPPELVGQTPLRVVAAADGGAYVGTVEGSFVRVHPDDSAEVWMSDPRGQVTRVAVKDEQTQAFALRFGSGNGIYLAENGVVRPIYIREEVGRRWTGLVFRGETLWAVSTGEVLAITENGNRIELLGPEQGFDPGGEAVVDHEKSLWMASFRGIHQFTEPDVVLWTELDGARAVHRIGDDTVVGRWRGPHRRVGEGDWQPLTPEGYVIFDWGGVSPWGTLWFVAVQYPDTPRRRSALLELGSTGWRHHATRDYGVFAGAFAADDSGVFWLAFHNTLWRVDGEGATPRAVAELAVDKGVFSGMVVEGDLVRMAFRNGPYCEGKLNAERTALEDDWACDTIEGAGQLLDFKMIDGVPWVGTWDRGVLRRIDGDWETVIDETDLDTSTIRGISVSPSGGVWVVTLLDRVRVELEDGRPRIVERLGPWIGVPNWMNFNVLEEDDGSLWLSGMVSATQVPRHARQRPTQPPNVFVTGFRADGRDLPTAERQALPATTRRIEVSWAAPAFRDPASLRYQVRADSTGDWVPTRERSFRFVDLGPGDYRIEVRASLDGETWSAAAADVRFAIRSPLWQRPTFWAAMLAVGTIGVLLMQWLRTRQQVRLERQRTDIAMNLHDELGAGLGSIGLLADLAADETMEPGESRQVVTRVGEISRGLSRSLSDIVWTLRPASVDLPGFALFLRQRASDLLSAGEAKVEFDFPDPVPPVRVELAVRRQIHAIASEALHNAAKHAGASKVSVGLRSEGDTWVLGITDDGVGFDDDGEPMGLGLASMNKRASSIGATLTIGVGEQGGCRVELGFTPRAGEQG
jgi:signal transduction histidine kinase/ligand-binding sensor domain-containing protein